MSNKMNELLLFVKSDKRVCPQPQKWNELWKLLPDRKQISTGGWKPPLPLILAAWWHTNDSEKRNRLNEHIQYANEKGVVKEVSNFLHSLSPDDWLYEGDI
jgi:hypothetical protein